jgi:hypothetical protein
MYASSLSQHPQYSTAAKLHPFIFWRQSIALGLLHSIKRALPRLVEAQAGIKVGR